MRKSIKRNLAYDDQKDLYYVTMHYGMRPDGSRDRCVRTFHCLDDAESTLTEFLRLRALKRTRHGGEVILADWLEVWLRDFICPNREKTTVHGYENIIRLHLVPALGEVKLPELQPAQLQRYYAELLEKGLSHNTVRKHHVLLHTALEAAVRQGLLRSQDPVIIIRRIISGLWPLCKNRTLLSCCLDPYSSAVVIPDHIGRGSLPRELPCELWSETSRAFQAVRLCRLEPAFFFYSYHLDRFGHSVAASPATR